MAANPGYRVAADIGGTFTDIVLLAEDGTVSTRKVPSTPADYAVAILTGICDLLAERGLETRCVGEVLHASTIATNAILENKGAKTALITTAGFRDVLEMRRIRMPRLYEPLYRKPLPLVPRRRRYELTERIGPDGEIIVPFDREQAAALVDELAASDVEAIAVTFLHSYANPQHEQWMGEMLRARMPDRFVSLSIEVLPEIREYERTSTTVVNAYIGPTIARYLRSLRRQLDDAGLKGRLLMMQSSGGILDADRVVEKPAQIVESGPAAGVIAAARIGRACGYPNLITLDMGGTTAKAAVIEDGKLVSTDEYEVGGGISLSSRLVKGAGYVLKLPVIDVSEVGAGGGSIAWIDAGGSLKVGPHSAGSVPGPVCYRGGGTEPTVTDANVALGFLSPTTIAGGTLQIDHAGAVRALTEKIALPLGRDVRDIAHAVHQLANATMVRAVKAVTTYRGRDPRDFTLIAFGGSGGVHAVGVARALGIKRVIVPPAAGVFSALGLLFSPVELALSQAFRRAAERCVPAELDAAFESLERRAIEQIGHAAAEVDLQRKMDVRYVGQAFELTIAVPAGPTTAATITDAIEMFEQDHERTYGHRLQGESLKEIVTLRVTATVRAEQEARLDVQGLIAAQARPASQRTAFFNPELGACSTPVISRTALLAGPQRGPLLFDEDDTTLVVPPDAAVSLDVHGNIIVDLDEAT
jgi:N-methylhydantoinase A